MVNPVVQIAQPLVQFFEGLGLSVYVDLAGYKTVGYGHLLPRSSRVKNISLNTARILLASDLASAYKSMGIDVSRTLTEAQQAAVLSLVFNIGRANFLRSTLRKKILEGDLSAAIEFDKWIYARVNGVYQVVNGLIVRRANERHLYETGNYLQEYPA